MRRGFLVILSVVTAIPALCADPVRARASLRPVPEPDRSRPPVDRPVGAFRGPVLGLFANSARTEVRALVGVPGASLVSDPVPLPQGVERVFLAPAQRWALVERAGGAGLGAVSFDSAEAGPVTAIANSVPRIDLYCFSPSGRAAAVFSHDSGRLQVISFRSSQASLTGNWTLGPLAPALLAIDDAGRAPVVFTAQGAGYVIARDGTPQPVYLGGTVAAATYLSDASTLLVADSGTLRFTAISGLPSASASRVLAPAVPDLGGPLLIQPSTDGRSLFLAAAGARSAARLDLEEQRLDRLDLPASAGRFERLRNGNTFLFSAGPADPAWLLLGDEPGGRAVFAARPVDPAGQPPVSQGK